MNMIDSLSLSIYIYIYIYIYSYTHSLQPPQAMKAITRLLAFVLVACASTVARRESAHMYVCTYVCM